jgi:hypothetical protein
MRGKMIY